MLILTLIFRIIVYWKINNEDYLIESNRYWELFLIVFNERTRSYFISNIRRFFYPSIHSECIFAMLRVIRFSSFISRYFLLLLLRYTLLEQDCPLFAPDRLLNIYLAALNRYKSLANATASQMSIGIHVYVYMRTF